MISFFGRHRLALLIYEPLKSVCHEEIAILKKYLPVIILTLLLFRLSFQSLKKRDEKFLTKRGGFSIAIK